MEMAATTKKTADGVKAAADSRNNIFSLLLLARSLARSSFAFFLSFFHPADYSFAVAFRWQSGSGKDFDGSFSLERLSIFVLHPSSLQPKRTRAGGWLAATGTDGRSRRPSDHICHWFVKKIDEIKASE